MSPIEEILLQIGWLVVSVWFVYGAIQANKKAAPLSLHELFKDVGTRPDVFIAGGFVMGVVLLFLLAHKLLSCGLICW